MLTREAFNALLKTLEEPPPHVVFVLATTEPGKIPETITSRCQGFDFHRISSAEIEARLVEIASTEGFRIEEGALGMVAVRADGSMRDAVSLLDQLVSVGEGAITADDVARVLGIPDVDVFFALTDAIAEGNTTDTLTALRTALDSGFDARDLLDGLVEHLRNLLLAGTTENIEGTVGRASAYADRRGRSFQLSQDDLVRLLRIGIDAQASVKWSTQPGLIVEVALVRMARLPGSIEIAQVIRALSEETGGTGRGGGGTHGAGDGGTEEPPRASEGCREDDRIEKGGSSPRAGAGRGESIGASPNVATPVSVDEARWAEVLERIRGEKPALAAFLSEAVPSVAGDSRLELSVPNGSRFHREQLRDRANLVIMERAAGEVYGGKVSLCFAFGNAHREQAVARGAVQVSKEAAEDPVVRKVLDVFGGEITASRREE
jgi:DNA polymerase-3 subunit gamma/tau